MRNQVLVVKVAAIDNGFICDCQGHRADNRGTQIFVSTEDDLQVHLKTVADEWHIAQKERAAIADAESHISAAQKRYLDAQNAGLPMADRIAAALNFPE